MPQGARPSFGAEGGRVGGAGTSLLADLLLAGTGLTLTGASEPFTANVDLSTGKAGGQSVIGGTNTGDSLTIRPNSANAITGNINFIGAPGATTAFLSNTNGSGNMPQLVLGVAAAVSGGVMVHAEHNINATITGLFIQNPNAGPAAAINVSTTNGTSTFTQQLHSNGFATAGNVTAGTELFNLNGGSGNVLFRIAQASGDYVWETTAGNTERMRVANNGTHTLSNSPFVSYSSGATRVQAAGEVMAFKITPPNVASAAGATLDAYHWDAMTATVTGATNITTAAGFNFLTIETPTVSAASALTVTNSATVVIKGAPVGGGAGPATITNAYALWVGAGTSTLSRFDGQVNITGTGILNVGDGTSSGVVQLNQTGGGGNVSALGGHLFLNANTGTSNASAVRLAAGNGTDMLYASQTAVALIANSTTQNVQFFAAVGAAFNAGQNVILIANRTAAPTGNAASGGYLYAEAGALKWRGSAGTTTVIAPA